MQENGRGDWVGRWGNGLVLLYINTEWAADSTNLAAATSKNSSKINCSRFSRWDRQFSWCFRYTLGRSYSLTDPEIMESLACTEGLSLTSDLVFREMRIASDCAKCYKRWNSQPYSSRDQSKGTEFQKVEFMHEERTANIDTHRLTRFSIYEAAGRHVWLLQLFNGVCKSYFLRSTKFFLDISSLKKTYTTCRCFGPGVPTN